MVFNCGSGTDKYREYDSMDARRVAGCAKLHLSLVLLILVFGQSATAFVCPDYIYVFGDSLTDVGNAHAELPIFNTVTNYNYGMSYSFPDRPCERTRFSDGRLLIDYTAQAFGVPFLQPYSRHLHSSAYKHGVNFAYSGGTAKFTPIPFPTFFLEREVENYFKFRASYSGPFVNVSTALHMIPEIGANDYIYAFTLGLSPAEANAKLDGLILRAIERTVEKLHAGGARFFYIFNLPPVGCTPFMLTLFSHRSPKDQFGCLSAHNSVIEIANGKLKAAVDEYRRKWPDTIFLHYDSYGAALEVIQTGPAKYGIDADGFRACCGGGGPYNFNPFVLCGSGKIANVCPDPEHKLFWDFIHPTEAFFRVMATFALSGQYVDGPPEVANLKAACNLDFSSFAQSIPNSPSCPRDTAVT
ncbi:GDSL esterase/lipase At3g48460 [Physcomitrium patens]|uniref:Uncharacterized protein n=1 Tax=Physcomitrium patens TaxID=3218 RepID=A9RFU3_PHYPA|nr:GDSL esterase/lipase At3g48460-like [Physcomitrium patens]PNR59332.1 hypothetical protein PHYPA_002123 [Physcomitrium patens]|eukprot:XP_024368979.1 GDSL esterase/lipase At3g48460-like [Physcomitrella patens]